MEITPPGPAISVIDTDVEVDFAAPLGYIEPDYKKLNEPPPTMKDKFVIDTSRKQDVDARGSGSNTPIPGSGAGGSKDLSKKDSSASAGAAAWEAFKGSGASLGGKRIKGKGVSVKKIEAVDADSKIIRTEFRPLLSSSSSSAVTDSFLPTKSTKNNYLRHSNRRTTSSRRPDPSFRQSLFWLRKSQTTTWFSSRKR